MALGDLAADAVSVTLVAAEPDFVFRPMSVAEPFGLGEARRYPLRRVVDDFGAALVQAGVAAVDAHARRIVLRSGDTIGYDTLVLAPGARMLPAFDAAVTFGGPGGAAAMRALLEELEQRRVRRIAFAAPSVAGWALPLYELALLTARHAEQKRARARAGARHARAAPARAVRRSRERDGRRDARRGRRRVRRREPGRARRGRRPAPPGRPQDRRRSAGDAAVAARPRARRGAVGARLRLHPRRRARARRRPRRRVCGGRRDELPGQAGWPGHAAGRRRRTARRRSPRGAARPGAVPAGAARDAVRRRRRPLHARGDAVAAQPLWWPPTKIAGRYLAPYMYEREPAAEPGPAPEGFVDLEVPLEAADAAPVGR